MDWQRKALGDLCEFQRGITYSKGDEVSLSRNVVLRANNVNLETNQLDFSELKYIDNDIRISEKQKVKRDSLIICTASGSKTHLGKVAYIDENYDYAFGGFMGKLTPNHKLIAKYLFYLMISEPYRAFISTLADGMNINNLKFDDLKNFVVPYPEKVEQQRIVAILDEAFGSIATAKSNTEKNLTSTREIFVCELETIFGKPPTSWAESLLGTNVSFIDYRGRTPRKTTSGIRLITAKNVRMGYVKESPEEFIAPRDYDTWMTRGIPQHGDILFTTEAPLANVAQLTIREKVVFAQRIIIMHPDSSVLDSTFLKYALMSPPLQRAIHDKGTGATATGIKASRLKQIPIYYPTYIGEQKAIAKRLDQLAEECASLEQAYDQKSRLLLELKQSLLHKAFNDTL